MMKARFMALVAAATMFAIGCNSDIKVSPGQAYFASVTYTGNDPVFNPSNLASDEIFNPILQGAYSDASICRKGNDYYMATANYTFFPGVPVLHSTDLVNWEQICYAFPTEQQLMNTSLRAEQGIFPSVISYNKNDDTFYITGTLVGGGGHFIIKAKDPAGPWTDPEWLTGFGGVHPTLFFDNDGKAYLLNQGEPNFDSPYADCKAIWCQEFDLKSFKLVGDRRIILVGGDIMEKKPVWLEAPQLFRNGDFYYLLASEGGGLGNGFSTCVYRATNIWGPYEHYQQNPIVTQRRLGPSRPDAVTNTGRVNVVHAHDSSWYAVFQGVRPYSENNDFCQGRETYLMPVTWDNGWPYLIRNGEPILTKIKAPFGTKYNKDSAVFARYIPHGNFTYTEYFDSDTLPMQWMHLRTPSGITIIPNGERGLIMPLEGNNIRSQRHAGFIGIRLMHNVFSLATEMHFEPQFPSEFAGLAMYLNDERNYEFGLALRNDKEMLVLQKATRNDSGIAREDVKTINIPSNFEGRIFLKVDRKDDGFEFSYKLTQQDNYTVFVDKVPVEYLSLSRANSFMGVMLGIYASQEEEF
ncbi:MAG: glycoside hydrolase family 43 protein [Bacteroidales bacterium]|nr:glycoside hydrolase family 43 protein [Bacteroidales bacterium]